MKNGFIIYILLCFYVFQATGQTFEMDYKQVKSSGKLPEDFTLSANKRIQNEIAKLKIQNHPHNKELVINSQFDLKELFQSGYILLNDTISEYVHAVADKIIEQELGLKDKLKIYVIKSTEANAYCFENGTVLVNIGLIARLNNEAQLAYILSHEFIHYMRQHSLKTVNEYDKLDRIKASKINYEDKVLLKYRFSRENETEADTAGLALFRKTNYDLTQAAEALHLLQYSHLPFADLIFDKKKFEDENYKLPQTLFLEKCNPIESTQRDDLYQTHPDIIARQQCIDKLLNKMQLSGNKCLVSQPAFENVRNMCRFECCRMFLVERDYLNAFKWTYLLKQQYPDNYYLNRIMAKSLYALTLNKAGYLRFDDNSYHTNAIPDYTRIEGNSQQVNYFFNQIPAKELGILTVRFLEQSHLKYPADDWFVNTTDSMVCLLFGGLYMKPNEFNTFGITNGTEGYKYYSKAFVPYLGDSLFTGIYNRNTKSENTVGAKSTTNGLKKIQFGKEKASSPEAVANRNVKAPEIKKIMVVNPAYSYLFENKEKAQYNVKSEIKKNKLLKYLESNLQLAGIDYEIMDPGYFKENDIVRYNEYSEINTWLNERFDIGIENENIVLGTDSIHKILNKYDTKYLLTTSVKSVKHKRNTAFKVLYTYLWGVFVVTAPYLIYWNTEPDQDTEVRLSLFDTENGKLIKTSKYAVHSVDSKDVLNSYIYDFLYSLK